jgi:ankyrin repeat protein
MKGGMKNKILLNIIAAAAIVFLWNADIKAMLSFEEVRVMIRRDAEQAKARESEERLNAHMEEAIASTAEKREQDKLKQKRLQEERERQKLEQNRKLLEYDKSEIAVSIARKNKEEDNNLENHKIKAAAQYTALLKAAQEGDLNLVQKLINDGAYINGDYEENSMTPLMTAAEQGHEATVNILLQAGANPECVFKGKTAVDYALKNGHGLVAEMIKKKQWARIGKARKQRKNAKKEAKEGRRLAEETAAVEPEEFELAGQEEKQNEQDGSGWAGAELEDYGDSLA